MLTSFLSSRSMRTINYTSLRSISRQMITSNKLVTYQNSSKYSKNSSKYFTTAMATLFTSALVLNSSMHSSASFSSSCEAVAEKDNFADTAMYPPIKPYEKGTLKVSDIHTIAYSVYGNPNGKPVLVIHGGPGGGTTPAMARYFDPTNYRIILVDQRGCGESLPFAELRENTTYDSVRDFEKIRIKLGY